jgi:hypothetical protein
LQPRQHEVGNVKYYGIAFLQTLSRIWQSAQSLIVVNVLRRPAKIIRAKKCLALFQAGVLNTCNSCAFTTDTIIRDQVEEPF